MYKILCRRTFTLCGGVVVPQVSKELSESFNEEDRAVKWNRVKKVFILDEFGDHSPQLNTMIQTTLFSGFFGCFYGGFIEARDAYFKFIETNEATKFADHFEAKKQLQTKVTIGFGRGALRWGPRIALFGGFYVSFVTLFAAYRGHSSVIDFTLAGLLSGAIYRMHMGLKAIIASGVLGAFMGMFAGGLSSIIFKLSGTSLDDVHKYTKEVTSIRDKHYEEATKKKKVSDDDSLLELHDSIIFSKITQTQSNNQTVKE